MKRLRLVKVVVQPTFVIDDGDHLSEQTAEPIVVQPADWPTFSSQTFPEKAAELERRINGEDDRA